ncbi:hypothetical protein PCASD_03277 [Puccinia coronata f. sp. avenae]|uniref:NADH dehydrogenase [ubiquinone] 1 alpha subcomplex subunit 4 n=1 Tax=Puccinia coronata f. sp. avenae TaxID=200324 RepID=A0A2N5VE29_9BASI|nr:hypothetical protein PCASD_03277 [Puccinia coronata f. sp. avenae]
MGCQAKAVNTRFQNKEERDSRRTISSLSKLASNHTMSFRAAMKHWYDPAAIPIYVVIGTAMGGATWYLSRLARGPDIVWDRHNNPQPWNDVKQGQNTKMMAVNQEFPNGSYKRDKL